jgi:transcriptional regulator with XRE-family HTH domain
MDTPLRRWRIAKGLTQEQAGALVGKEGVKHTAFSRYERGERMPSDVLQDLHELTGLSYEALLRPKEYLEKHPNVLAKGVREVQKSPGRPRKIAVA